MQAMSDDISKFKRQPKLYMYMYFHGCWKFFQLLISIFLGEIRNHVLNHPR